MTNGRLTTGASSLRKLAREIYRAAVDTVLVQARARARRLARYTDPESAILSSTGPDRNYSRGNCNVHHALLTMCFYVADELLSW